MKYGRNLDMKMKNVILTILACLGFILAAVIWMARVTAAEETYGVTEIPHFSAPAPRVQLQIGSYIDGGSHVGMEQLNTPKFWEMIEENFDTMPPYDSLAICFKSTNGFLPGKLEVGECFSIGKGETYELIYGRKWEADLEVGFRLANVSRVD